MKRTVKAVLAERVKQRRALKPAMHTVRHVKFTPEEMADDPSPKETANWTIVGRGPGTIFAKPPERLTTVSPDADVAKVSKNSAAVNNALRKLIEVMPHPARRRSSTRT